MNKPPLSTVSQTNPSTKGEEGILLFPESRKRKTIFNAGVIASNFTSGILAIRGAFTTYMTDSQAMDTTEGLIILSGSMTVFRGHHKPKATNISSFINLLL
ncbi:hypothetical protein TNIN_324091 [Trichonephila inaurata madagascariensis]|uniref:Uncharacterized protein n=1 Tax=Trichonephila inaurata madagascariensis TaxID=2747483 RepID=A0A8X7CLS2_9ARAC|nr:hypothetical protein TNIN_324091 [Trichonephila inaurata madagascariensis]